MYFKQILNDENGCASYVLASRQSREAAVIDPDYDIESYLALAAERGYTIRYVIDTHLHADHVSGNRRLAAATGAEVCLHEAAVVLFPFRPLKDGETLHLGQVLLRVLHTPGHRPESISLVITNTARSPEPSMVLSGDTLFVGDVGRPDFGGPAGAAVQYQSIQKLLRLDDYVEVFPAHFEGSCGKGMCGRPSSTIGFERRFNPLLQVPEREFVHLASEVPARPLNMLAILATNRGEADYAWAHPCGAGPVESIGVEQARSWLQAEAPFILDLREPTEYQAGHLPGAVLIPQAELATRLDEVPRNRPILAVCASGARSFRAARFLKRLGYDHVVNLEGGTNAWVAAGQVVETSPPAAA